jgi:hypothetical protein
MPMSVYCDIIPISVLSAAYPISGIPDIGYAPISGIPDIGYTPMSVYCDIMPISVYPTSENHDIGYIPISGIIEISADIGVNIAIMIFRDRRTIRRYRCSARIQMLK